MYIPSVREFIVNPFEETKIILIPHSLERDTLCQITPAQCEAIFHCKEMLIAVFMPCNKHIPSNRCRANMIMDGLFYLECEKENIP